MARFKCAKNQVVWRDGKVAATAENGIIETNNQGLVDYIRTTLRFEEIGREYKRKEREEAE